MKPRINNSIIGITIAMFAFVVLAEDANQSRIKTASESTKTANQSILKKLPFDDQTDFRNANRGFIATIPGRKIKEGNRPIYNMEQFDFLNAKAPDTVNPSLWRQSQLNAIHGLFEVGQGIYQIRGFDLANMSFIRGEKGWIVVDTLIATEAAAAGFELLKKHVADLPITTIIITHSHTDHFGGIRGLISDDDVKSGKVKFVAPQNFFKKSVNENLMGNNQMSRRSSYMYGNILPKSPTGSVGSGLGATTATGTISILEPTIVIKESPTELTLDGIKMIFLNTPGAEAPSELMFYMPKKKAMCQAEEINHTLHNLYTLRGAQVRNGLLWSKYIHETIERFGDDVEISFGSHNWPTWGNKQIVKFWKIQRDTYRYIHDEVLRLANHGKTMLEVAEEIQLPDSLAREFACRGYYGTVNHNAKAQYQLYFGFFSGNPADLHPLPPAEAGKKFVEYAGGPEAVIQKAKRDFENGEYRWAATALNHVVFADSNNKAARELLADTYEQLGYQAESGPWRNFYLSGAKELREGIRKKIPVNNSSEDLVKSLTLEAYLDYIAVRLNHPKAAGKVMTFNFTLPDRKQKYTITVENGVMNYSIGRHAEKADASITLDRTVLDAINLRRTNVERALIDGRIKIEGNLIKLGEFLSLLDQFDFWFNIVTD